MHSESMRDGPQRGASADDLESLEACGGRFSRPGRVQGPGQTLGSLEDFKRKLAESTRLSSIAGTHSQKSSTQWRYIVNVLGH